MIEAFVPDPGRFDRGRLAVRQVELELVRLEASRHDPVSQTIDGQAIELREHGARFFPFRIRYAWPSELDLMARLAGLRLRERWGGGAVSRLRPRASSTSPSTSADRLSAGVYLESLRRAVFASTTA